MKAELRVAYPNGVNKDDLYDFIMKDQIELEVISPEGATDKNIFFKGGKISGTPVRAAIKNLDTDQVALVEGVIVKDPKGAYLIPKKFVEKAKSLLNESKKETENLIDATEKIAEETVQKAKNFDPEKTFGFTGKQLLVMGVTVLIIVKIFK